MEVNLLRNLILFREIKAFFTLSCGNVDELTSGPRIWTPKANRPMRLVQIEFQGEAGVDDTSVGQSHLASNRSMLRRVNTGKQSPS